MEHVPFSQNVRFVLGGPANLYGVFLIFSIRCFVKRVKKKRCDDFKFSNTNDIDEKLFTKVVVSAVTRATFCF